MLKSQERIPSNISSKQETIYSANNDYGEIDVVRMLESII